MRIALAPYMHRHLSLTELPRLAADLGYEYLELSPRADFLESSRFMRQEIQCCVDKHWGAAA